MFSTSFREAQLTNHTLESFLTNKRVMLVVGPSGCGKDVLCKNIAELLKKQMIIKNVNPLDEESLPKDTVLIANEYVTHNFKTPVDTDKIKKNLIENGSYIIFQVQYVNANKSIAAFADMVISFSPASRDICKSTWEKFFSMNMEYKEFESVMKVLPKHHVLLEHDRVVYQMSNEKLEPIEVKCKEFSPPKPSKWSTKDRNMDEIHSRIDKLEKRMDELMQLLKQQ